MWVWNILIYFCWRAVLSQMSLTFSPSQWHVFSFSWWYLFSLRAENFNFNKLSSLVPPLTDLTFGAHAGFFHITSVRSIGLHTTPQPVTQFDLMVCQRKGCVHMSSCPSVICWKNCFTVLPLPLYKHEYIFVAVSEPSDMSHWSVCLFSGHPYCL